MKASSTLLSTAAIEALSKHAERRVVAQCGKAENDVGLPRYSFTPFSPRWGTTRPNGVMVMVRDFGSFLVKVFFGRYDEMSWDDAFHAVVLVFLVSAMLYVLV